MSNFNDKLHPSELVTNDYYKTMMHLSTCHKKMCPNLKGVLKPTETFIKISKTTVKT